MSITSAVLLKKKCKIYIVHFNNSVSSDFEPNSVVAHVTVTALQGVNCPPLPAWSNSNNCSTDPRRKSRDIWLDRSTLPCTLAV